MTSALTPALALAYLRELSTDIRAAVVLDAGGGRLAGDAPAAAAAARLLVACEGLAGDDATASPGAPSGLAARVPTGFVALGRGDGVAIVVAAGPHALPALLLHDLVATAGELSPGPPSNVALDAASLTAALADAQLAILGGDGRARVADAAQEPARAVLEAARGVAAEASRDGR